MLVHYFRLMPPFNLGEGLLQLTLFYLQASLADSGSDASGDPAAPAPDSALNRAATAVANMTDPGAPTAAPSPPAAPGGEVTPMAHTPDELVALMPGSPPPLPIFFPSPPPGQDIMG